MQARGKSPLLPTQLSGKTRLIAPPRTSEKSAVSPGGGLSAGQRLRIGSDADSRQPAGAWPARSANNPTTPLAVAARLRLPVLAVWGRGEGEPRPGLVVSAGLAADDGCGQGAGHPLNARNDLLHRWLGRRRAWAVPPVPAASDADIRATRPNDRRVVDHSTTHAMPQRAHPRPRHRLSTVAGRLLYGGSAVTDNFGSC